MNSKIRYVGAVIAALFAFGVLAACESPTQQSEYPVIESISWGDCYVDTSDPYDPIAGRDITVEIKNNMPLGSDPDIGSMVVAESQGGPSSPITPALPWDAWSDEDGQNYYVDGNDYNVVEPQQTATVTFFHEVPETQFFLTFAIWFLDDRDGDGTIEAGILGDDATTQGWAWVGDSSCDVCPPGQVWSPSAEACTLP